MPDDTPDLTAPAVLHHAYSTLQEQLPLHAEGYTCTTDDLLKGVLGVAVTRGTIESVCADLVGTPAPQTLRGYLTAQLRVEELPDWDRRLNTALAAEVPPRVRCHAQEIALDSQDRPSYGKAAQAAGLWVRGQATDGITRFYRVATASLSLNGLRLTLALPFVLPTDDLVSVLAPWLTQVKGLGVQVTGLRLDTGCAGMAGRESLTAHHQPALSACPNRGTTGGTRALCQGRKSSGTRHTFKGAHGREFTATGAVGRGCTTARRTQRLKRRGAWLLFSLIPLDLSPRYVRQLDRDRFGSETSSRCTGQVRGWTTANTPAYRFVLLALAVVLLKVWLPLRWIFTQVPRRGGRWLDTQRFSLPRFARFIQRALEHGYGCIQIITAPAVPRC